MNRRSAPGLSKLLKKGGAVVSGISVLGFHAAGTSSAHRNTHTVTSVLDYHAPDKRHLTQRLDQR